MNGRFLAVDIGGSRIKSALVINGDALEYAPKPVARDLAGLLHEISETYKRAASGEELQWGLCMPGLLDAAAGTVRYSANLGLRDVPVVQLLSKRKVPRPCVFVNDLVASAVGEAG